MGQGLSRGLFGPLEGFCAKFNFGMTCVVVLWKTVGMGWLPTPLRLAWEAMFAPGTPYYPRKPQHEAAYNMFFLALYGLGGVAAQVASMNLLKPFPPRWCKHAFGGFHCLIALYHNFVGFRLVGKAGMMDLPGLSEARYVAPLTFALELALAARFAARPSYDQDAAEDKACLDFVSLLSMIPTLAFWPMAVAKIDNKFLIASIYRASVIYGPIAVLGYQLFLTQYKQSKVQIEEQQRQQDELRRQQEERQRQQELKRQQDLSRQQQLELLEQQRRQEELQRQQELKRQQDLSRQQQLELLEEQRRQEELQRQQELKRQQDLSRQQHLERLEEQRRQEEQQKIEEQQHQQDELRCQQEGQSRLVAYNAETDTKKFTDVKGFVSVEEAAKGVYHTEIPNGTPLDAVDPMPANDNDLWLLRIQDLDMVRYAGSDRLGQQKAREKVRQGGNQIWVRRKHIKVESRVMVYNAETDTKKFTDVKGFLSVDQVARGVHHVDVPNWTRLDPVGPLSNNDNDYCTLKIQDLDMVSYAGSDELGRQRAREAVQRNGNQIVIKRKHLKVNPILQNSGAVATQLPAARPASHLMPQPNVAAQPLATPTGPVATQLPSLPNPAIGAAQLPGLPATGPASSLMPQPKVPGAAPAQTQAAAPARPATQPAANCMPVAQHDGQALCEICGKPTWDGNPGTCSKVCLATLQEAHKRQQATAMNYCPCGLPTWDGNPGYCCLDHQTQYGPQSDSNA